MKKGTRHEALGTSEEKSFGRDDGMVDKDWFCLLLV